MNFFRILAILSGPAALILTQVSDVLPPGTVKTFTLAAGTFLTGLGVNVFRSGRR